MLYALGMARYVICTQSTSSSADLVCVESAGDRPDSMTDRLDRLVNEYFCQVNSYT
jgi:hypothetical protein